jgi:hypothetical protein
MHSGTRRIFAMVGLGLLAMALVFPASVAAKPHRTIPADVLGDHVWTGQLCDGTAVSVAYHVTARGRLVFDSASAPARVQKHRGWFRVRFKGTPTRMMAFVHWGRHGVLHLHVRSWQGKCDPPPAGDPPPVDDGGHGQTG